MSWLTRLVLLICLLPQLAFGLTCDTAQAGDWGTAATWQNCGGGVPELTDEAVLNHAVTVSGTEAVGNDTSTVVSVATGGGELTIETGGTLTVDGDIAVQDANFTMEAGSTLNMASDAVYSYISTAPAFNSSLGNIRIGSEGGARVTITATGTSLVRFAPTGLNGYPQDIEIYNTDFTLGTLGAGNPFMVIDLDGTYRDNLKIVNSTFDDAGEIVTGLIHGAATLLIQDNTWTNSRDNASHRLIYTNLFGGVTTGSRAITGNVFTGKIYIQENRGISISDNYFLAQNESTFTNSQDFSMTLFDSNFFRTYNGSNINIDTASFSDNYILCDQSGKTNPHSFISPTRNIGTSNFLRNTWEFAGTDNQGDAIQIGTATGGPNTLNIKNNLVLPSTGGAGGSFGTVFTAAGNANTTLVVEHNTGYVGADQASSNTTCFVVGESYSGHAGFLNSHKSNICYTDDATPTNTLYNIRDQTGTTLDLLTSSNASHNTSFNVGSGAAFSATCSNFNFTSGDCETSAEDSDPLFLDATRSLLALYETCSGDGTPTYAEAFTELEKKNLATWDTCFDDWITWVRNGHSPSTDWAGSLSGHDSATIGAIESGLGRGGTAKDLIMLGVG